MVDGNSTLSLDLLEVTVGDSLAKVAKYHIQDHRLRVMYALEINRHPLLYLLLLFSHLAQNTMKLKGPQIFATQPNNIPLNRNLRAHLIELFD